MKDRLLTLPQYLIPQHGLSRLIGAFASSNIPFIKDIFIQNFARMYDVNMSEALEENLEKYNSFNDFFTRELKADARPIDSADNSIVSPADGAIAQFGDIHKGNLMQAKGFHFSAQQLLGGDADLAAQFDNGQFATVYLSPKDYHRVHMPLGGTLTQMIHVPGKLFSVNQRTSEQVPALFARNERVVCMFDTAIGPMAVVLVGAMIVASIETVFAGLVAPAEKAVRSWEYQKSETIQLEKGAELGRFKLGSTAIVLFPKDTMKWNDGVANDDVVQMGQGLGQLI